MVMKKFRHSRKGLSPVVASIILIAVAVAVSLAVSAWLGGLTSGYMATEQLSITSAQFVAGNAQTRLYATNSGTNSVTIKQITINGITPTAATYAYNNGTALIGTTIPPNTNAVVTLTSPWTNGFTYVFKIVTAKGNVFQYVATAR
jgi:flagellin-like protein